VRDLDPRVTALARLRGNCTVNYRPVLSLERAPHIKKPAIVRQETQIWEPHTKIYGLTDHSSLKKIVGLERGPLSLVSTTEELLDRKVAAPV
jgi:hypothetical protein